MVHYFLAFIIPAIMAILQPSFRPWKSWGFWILMLVLYVLFMGLRDVVGGDWLNYLEKFNLEAYGMTYMDALEHGDPGYWLLQVLAHDYKWGIHGVNTIGAIFSLTGLIVFVRRLPNPWLGFTIAISYAVVVVMFGYVRQGIALGFVFWGIVALGDKRFLRFVFLIILAASFHKSAVVMIGLGLFQQGKGKIFKVVAIIIIAVGVYAAFMSGNEGYLVKQYVDAKMQSSGALIRVIMNLIPGLIFLWYRKEWQRQYTDYGFWHLIALGSIASLFLVGFASTAVDRMALYFIPIQIVVFSRLPYLNKHFSVKLITLIVILYYGLAYFVWLNFAANAYAWHPYNNLLLPDDGI